MEEDLLTEEEIRHIELTVRNSPILRHPDVIQFGNERTSIYKVTTNNGLILIKGDRHTGFTHINDRHNFWSEKNFWKQNNQENQLDDPSKFSKKSFPIIDYTNIADALFKEENLNFIKNKRPDTFDLYCGNVDDLINGKMNYYLILYKGTKIIHTLFPEKKIHNKKKYLNYVRGKAEGKLIIKDSIFLMSVPYLDFNNTVIYSFQIIRNLITQKETGIIINHKKDWAYTIFEKEILNFGDINNDLETFARSDFSQIEQLIKRLDKE